MTKKEILSVLSSYYEVRDYLEKMAHEVGMAEDPEIFLHYALFSRVAVCADWLVVDLEGRDGPNDYERVRIPLEWLDLPWEEILKLADQRGKLRQAERAAQVQRALDRLKRERREHYLHLKEEFGDA